jgi:hypothetical protein
MILLGKRNRNLVLQDLPISAKYCTPGSPNKYEIPREKLIKVRIRNPVKETSGIALYRGKNHASSAGDSVSPGDYQEGRAKPDWAPLVTFSGARTTELE